MSLLAQQAFLAKAVKENEQAKLEQDSKYPEYTPLQTCFHYELIAGKWQLVPSI